MTTLTDKSDILAYYTEIWHIYMLFCLVLARTFGIRVVIVMVDKYE